MDDSYIYVPGEKIRLAPAREVTNFVTLRDQIPYFTPRDENSRIAVKFDDPRTVVVRKVRYP